MDKVEKILDYDLMSVMPLGFRYFHPSPSPNSPRAYQALYTNVSSLLKRNVMFS